MAKCPLQICRYAEEPDSFLNLLSAQSACDFADPQSFPIAARYYAEYFGSSYDGDASFIAHFDGEPIVIMRGQSIRGLICDNGQCISLFVAPDKINEAALLDMLEGEIARQGAYAIRILDHAPTGIMSQLGRCLMFRRAVPKVRVVAVVDLTLSELALRKGVRKSYRSLINWGMKTLRFQYLDAETFDAQAFELFHRFHIRTSGRETRSQASWNLQAEMIKAHRAELALSYLGDMLVGGSLFLDTGATTTYGVGVYERTLFDKPLSHAPIFLGMLRARARGQRRFFIGDVPSATSPQDKEFSIGWFKSGFTANLSVNLDWTYQVREISA